MDGIENRFRFGGEAAASGGSRETEDLKTKAIHVKYLAEKRDLQLVLGGEEHREIDISSMYVCMYVCM